MQGATGALQKISTGAKEFSGSKTGAMINAKENTERLEALRAIFDAIADAVNYSFTNDEPKEEEIESLFTKIVRDLKLHKTTRIASEDVAHGNLYEPKKLYAFGTRSKFHHRLAFILACLKNELSEPLTPEQIDFHLKRNLYEKHWERYYTHFKKHKNLNSTALIVATSAIESEVKEQRNIAPKKEPHAVEMGQISQIAYIPNPTKYEEHIQRILNTNKGTHLPDDALILLIERFSRSSLKKVTIVAEDLSFLFKIVPVITQFLIKPEAKICVLFAPKNGYSLLREMELTCLYKLGAEIEILDPKESFGYYGFIFDYFAPTDEDKLGSAEFYRIRSNHFDREPIIAKWTLGADATSGLLINAVKAIQLKRGQPTKKHPIKAVSICKARQLQGEVLNGARIKEYEEWLSQILKRNQIERNDPIPPLYSKISQEENSDIVFKFEVVNFDDIFFRAPKVIYYKTFKGEKLFREEYIKGTIAEYQVTNLHTGDFSFYPMNVPILEWNPLEKRYEIAEGHNRLYYLHLCQQRVKKVKVLVVYGLPPLAFELIPNTKGVISKDWKSLELTNLTFERQTVYLMKRHIEDISHPLSTTLYLELAKKLIDAKILSIEDARLFLGERRGGRLAAFLKDNS